MTSPTPKKQVNFRVTAEEWNVLRAIANIDEVSTVPSAAYKIVRRPIDQAMNDEHVQADLANRAVVRARESAGVVPIKRQRRARPPSPSA